MRNRIFLVVLLCILQVALRAESYPEVIFDNSLVKGSYARSKVNYTGHSWVENVQGNLLVSDSLFFTPGNALSLKYQSADQGDWDVLIRYSRQKFHYRVNHDDVLNLKLFIATPLTDIQDLPSISIQQGKSQSVSVPLAEFVEDFNHSTWVNVKIPLRVFAGLNVDRIISGIRFRQLTSSSKLHHLYLDQIEFLPARYSEAPLTSSAVLQEATGHGHHVELKWQVPLTPSIRYVKVYRSQDNKEFKAVAIRPTYMLSGLDRVPALDKKYYYKIAWVDYNYRESPFSEVIEVEASSYTEEKLLDLVQSASINHFVENYDVNSGMYMPFRMQDKAPVSVQETGGALLSLLIGVEKGNISRSLFLNRTQRVVDFLENAQNNDGFFPAFFDGRKGLPLYLDDQPKYDVVATSSLIESLLIIRQYLSEDTEQENQLRAKITLLWDRLNWRNLTLEKDSLLIRGTIDMVDEVFSDEPLVGLNAGLSAYMLAVASPSSGIPPEAFRHAIEFRLPEKAAVVEIDEEEVSEESKANASDSTFTSSDIDASSVWTRDEIPGVTDSLTLDSARLDTIMYGIQLPFGPPNTSLLDMFRPFRTISPENAVIGDLDLQDVLLKYTQVVKRRDNEIGVGTTHSDIWGFYQRKDSVGSYRINPAISIASAFLDEQQAYRSLNTLYEEFGEGLFSEYGFRSWLDLRTDDVADEYLGVNQSSIAILLENARNGLIWNLYQAIPEIRSARDRIFKPKGK